MFWLSKPYLGVRIFAVLTYLGYPWLLIVEMCILENGAPWWRGLRMIKSLPKRDFVLLVDVRVLVPFISPAVG